VWGGRREDEGIKRELRGSGGGGEEGEGGGEIKYQV